MNLCQSCGMPMESQDLYGKNKDGSPNEEYCLYCYPNGEFLKPDETMEEMIETCIPHMVSEDLSSDQARAMLEQTLPTLKRWK